MLDMNSLPVSGGLIVGAALWAGLSAFALGPIVAERTIDTSGWDQSCRAEVTAQITERRPERAQAAPSVSCGQVMGLFGTGGTEFCRDGGDQLFDLMTIDPTAQAREAARQRELRRLDRIAAAAPSRCDCAAQIVAADRVPWGLYAGSARMIGGPQDLHSELTRALRSPACSFEMGE